jgi:hypothetical protein
LLLLLLLLLLLPLPPPRLLNSLLPALKLGLTAAAT